MRRKPEFVEIAKITSFKLLLNELNRLKIDLPKNNLNQFLVFNDAYFIITQKIQLTSKKNYFKNPKFIEKFTVGFASYYFKAVNETVNQSTKLPAAWKIVNKTYEFKNTPKFIFLLMGANAHINHDMPLTILKLMGDKTAEGLFSDVVKIDKILMKSGREIISTFKEQNKLVDLVKCRFVFLYYQPIMYMILYWRIRAWRNFKRIKKQGVQKSGYSKYSIKIANRFLVLSRVF